MAAVRRQVKRCETSVAARSTLLHINLNRLPIWGHWPYSSLAFTAAPRSSSRAIIPSCPFSAAMCSAVPPRLSHGQKRDREYQKEMSAVGRLALMLLSKIRERWSFGLRASFGQHHVAGSAHGANELLGIIPKKRKPHIEVDCSILQTIPLLQGKIFAWTSGLQSCQTRYEARSKAQVSLPSAFFASMHFGSLRRKCSAALTRPFSAASRMSLPRAT